MFDENVLGTCPDPQFKRVTTVDWRTFNLFTSSPLLAKWREINHYMTDADILELICPRPVKWFGSIAIFVFAAVAACLFLLAAYLLPQPLPKPVSDFFFAGSIGLFLCGVVAVGQIMVQLRRRKKNAEQVRWFLTWVNALRQALEIETLPQLCSMSWEEMNEQALGILFDLAISFLFETEKCEADAYHAELNWAYKVFISWQVIHSDYGSKQFIDNAAKISMEEVMVPGFGLASSSV